MSLTFGKTKVRNFARVFQHNPRLLTRSPYLNFLRHYKRLNPKYGFQRLLEDGARTWKRLKPQERALYTQKEIMNNYKKNNSLVPGYSFPTYPIEFDYERRSMNAEKNIARSWQKKAYKPPSSMRSIPKVTRYWMSTDLWRSRTQADLR